MQLLNPQWDLEAFWRSVRNARERLLLLDYDGTLAPFQVNRHEAFPYEGLEPLIDGSMQQPRTRVVLVSGRWTKDLLQLINLKQRPEIWGSHGWERMGRDGSCEVVPIPAQSLEALASMEDWLREAGLDESCEPKPACVAVHWRGKATDEIEHIRRGLNERWRMSAYEHLLELHAFDGGLEIRVPGRTKGDAVREILSGCHGDFTAAYLGDDTTDEDAFAELAGQGLSVLVRTELRPTAADIWLKPPEELFSFLAQWRENCI